MRFFIKNRTVLSFTLIVPQLHAEFQKNRWSGFRDQGDITEPVAFAGSISGAYKKEHVIYQTNHACFEKVSL